MEQPSSVPGSTQGSAETPAACASRPFGLLRWAVVLAAAVYFVTCGLWDPRREWLRVFLGVVIGGSAIYGDLRGCGRGRYYNLIALVFFVVGSLANVVLAGRSDG